MNSLYYIWEVGRIEFELLDNISRLFHMFISGQFIDEHGSAMGASFHKGLGFIDCIGLNTALKDAVTVELFLVA